MGSELVCRKDIPNKEQFDWLRCPPSTNETLANVFLTLGFPKHITNFDDCCAVKTKASRKISAPQKCFLFIYLLGFKVAFYNKGNPTTGKVGGGAGATCRVVLVYNGNYQKNCVQRRVPMYTVLPNWKIASFQCVIVSIKTTYLLLV